MRRSTLFKALAPIAVIGGMVFAHRSRRKNIAKFTERNNAERPVGPDGIVIGGGAIDLEGSATCVAMLVHGFGDTPQSMRPLAEALNRAGWSVHVMLLPGHARPLAEYAKSTADDWTYAVRAKYVELRDK